MRRNKSYKNLSTITTEDTATHREKEIKIPLTATIGTETLPVYCDFSTADVFYHSGHILFHDFFTFEGFTYSLFLKRNIYLTLGK